MRKVKVKFGLQPKFMLLFFVFTVVLSTTIAYVTKLSYQETIIEKYYDNAVSVAKLAASVMDGDRVKEYAISLEETEEYYKDLERLNNIKKETDVYYLYMMYPTSKETGIYIFDTMLTEEQQKELDVAADDISYLGYPVEFANDFPSALKVLATGKPSEHLDITTTLQGDINQTLASAYAPVKDSKGNTVAFIGVDVNMTDVNTYVKETSFDIIVTIVFITLLCFLVLMYIVQHSVINPIKLLTGAVERLANGEFGKPMKVHGHDEISEITRVFNRMSENIKGHVNEINEINEAYHKYVPSKFFELLHKDLVTDVRLGNQAESELYVMSFNLYEFQSMIRYMDSEEMFNFVNNVLRHVIPLVSENQGVIEKFKDGGFTAFYDQQCELALKTGISICEKMETMNRFSRFGIDKQVSCSIGITYGSVMLGIVGHDSRMSAITISQQTKVADYLQTLAPKYHSHIIITGTASNHIVNFEQTYHYRWLGFLKNSSTGKLERFYDVYDGDLEEDKRLKMLTKEVFERGVELYCAKKFYEARSAFVEVLKLFRKDSAAREYLYRCNQYYQLEDVSEIEIYVENY